MTYIRSFWNLLRNKSCFEYSSIPKARISEDKTVEIKDLSVEFKVTANATRGRCFDLEMCPELLPRAWCVRYAEPVVGTAHKSWLGIAKRAHRISSQKSLHHV